MNPNNVKGKIITFLFKTDKRNDKLDYDYCLSLSVDKYHVLTLFRKVAVCGSTSTF